MALLYGYATGSQYESYRYDQIADLLEQIPNNTINLIKAEDVRDSVFSLWERISDLSLIVASSSNTPTLYSNNNPTLVTVGGINQGTLFSTPNTLQQMFDKMLYPYTLPVISLSQSIVREYSQNLSHTFTWSVIKKTNQIQTININNISITPITGNNQTSTRNVLGTYSFPLPASTINNFQMNVFDGFATASTIATITFMNKIYSGTINLNNLTIPNPDLTLNPENSVLVSNIITSNIIKALSSELSVTKSKSYLINGLGNYLIFAWPSAVSNAYLPYFSVNGLANTAFTRVKTDWPFLNASNVTTNYEVWISNTAQNSPLNITIS